eukprot:Mycagemm_TRINITY_DN10806_c0_g1::TRINITY_DN10806_c0_g1_i1::g.4382::m.4382 type:complete len:118 gc:universal TRINITY_DN10806_c0_g1_i1:461-108(-)
MSKGQMSPAEVVKQMETLIKGVETSLRMMDASKKSVATNAQNKADAEAGAPGTNLSDSQKSLASAEDLYAAHRQNGQQKVNIVLGNYERAKAHFTPELKARFEKMIEGARNHGLNVA